MNKYKFRIPGSGWAYYEAEAETLEKAIEMVKSGEAECTCEELDELKICQPEHLDEIETQD